MANNDEQLTSVAVEAQEEALDAMTDDEIMHDEDGGPRQLSFGFAKRNHVLLETNETPAVLYYTVET
ncbi:MAG: hypothetical protein NZ789_03480, partial [Pseudomonadales bacterium]|nr:hypothetical protein [Pseudomonadales bacterium]